MCETKIVKLNKYAKKCSIIASARVYESDREVADSIKKICEDRKLIKQPVKHTFGVMADKKAKIVLVEG